MSFRTMRAHLSNVIFGDPVGQASHLDDEPADRWRSKVAVAAATAAATTTTTAVVAVVTATAAET